MSKYKKPLAPHPLVQKPARHPFKWTKQQVERTFYAVVGAHWGKFIIVAIYFLLLGWKHTPLHQTWNTLVATDWRHSIRGVGEGLLGGTLGQILAFDRYKKKVKPVKWYDRVEWKLGVPNRKNPKPLTGWQRKFWWVYVILYAIPGFIVGFYFMKLVHASVFAASKVVGGSYWNRVETIWTSDKLLVVIGLFASLFMGRRPVTKVADDFQSRRAERRIAQAKEIKWYHTAAFEARWNELMHKGVRSRSQARRRESFYLGLVIVIGLVLGGFGYYVLTEIAV